MVRPVAQMLREAHAAIGLDPAANVVQDLAADAVVVIDVRQHDEYAAGRRVVRHEYQPG